MADFTKIGNSIIRMLNEKNKRYGDSALQPLGIFSSFVSEDNSEAFNGIMIRLDDKLKRVANADRLRKNDIADLIGYLFLLCKEMDWEDFEDLID